MEVGGELVDSLGLGPGSGLGLGYKRVRVRVRARVRVGIRVVGLKHGSLYVVRLTQVAVTFQSGSGQSGSPLHHSLGHSCIPVRVAVTVPFRVTVTFQSGLGPERLRCYMLLGHAALR